MADRLALKKIRLDKWLWAARFFKTRALASEAITGGKVHVNQQRVKPARNVSEGDELDITRDTEVFQVTIMGVNDKRRPAKEAQLLYEESEESQERRKNDRELKRLQNAGFKTDSKPDKKQRRQMRRFKEL